MDFWWYVFSGSTCGEISIEECLDKIADCINEAHAKTKYVITGRNEEYCLKL